MNAALFKLLRLRIIGFFRRFATRGNVAKRVAGGVLALLIFFSWVGPAIVSSFARTGNQIDLDKVLAFAPMVIALMVSTRLLFAAGSRSLAFTPAEVDFLFPGPFSRRQLLLYKLIGGMAGAVLVSVLFTSRLRGLSASWLSAFLLMILTFLLMQFLGVAVALARQRLGQSIFGRGVLILGALLPVALALAAWPSIKEAIFAGGPPDPAAIFRSIAAHVHDSTFARVVLSPFEIFARVLVTPPGFALAGWVLAAVGILALLLWLIFRLDSAYAEAAVAASAKLATRMERVKRRGLPDAAGAAITLPTFPRLYGAGPLAWRQAVAAVRSYRLLLFFVGIMGLMVALITAMDKKTDVPAYLALMPMMIPMYFVLMNALRFDFRADIDHMDTLKTLPVTPAAVALGQVLVPTLLIVGLVGAAVIGMHSFGSRSAGSERIMWWTLLALPPGALLLAALENIVFLYMPTRNVAGTAADMNVMLRYVAVRFIKLFLLLPCAAAIGGIAVAAWFLTKSPGITFGSGLVALCALSIGSVVGVAYAFERFDPSRDLPS